MITKTTLEDELGKIDQYDIDLDLEPTKQIILRKVGDLEIILKHEDKKSELYVQFKDFGEDYTTIIERYNDLYSNSTIPELKKSSIEYYLRKKFIMYLSLNQVHKLFLTHKLLSKKYELSKLDDYISSTYSDQTLFQRIWGSYSNGIKLFIPISERYALIKNELNDSLNKNDFEVYKNIKKISLGLEYPELNKGITLYFKFKGKKAYEKSEKLLRDLFFLKEKDYSLDDSIKKIEDAWSG